MNSKLIILLAFVALMINIISCTQPEKDNTQAINQKQMQPNIIFILADDMGYADPGFNGNDIIKTPNLDRLAAEGMIFTQMYAGNTVCAPSRSTLMTGLHAGHTPVRGNKEIMPIGQYPLPDSAVTVAEVLKEAGYATGAFGKWGLGYPGSEGVPSNQGFDEFFGYICQRRAHFYYPEFLFHDVKGKELQQVTLEGNKVNDNSRENFQHPGSGPPITRGIYSQDAITEKALSFIDRNAAQPFFLYFPSPLPHASMTVPEEAMKPYLNEKGESIFEEKPFAGDHWTAQSMPKAAYAAMITLLDSHIGQILDKLEEKGIADNTLIMFSSDNGSHVSGGYHFSMLNSDAPFRGGKRDLYEGGIRVPMMAWWPGKVQAGSTTHHISAFQDMMPTFADLAGAQPPVGVDGLSIVPTLEGKEGQQQHEYLYWEFTEQGGKQAVRKGPWKAVKLEVSTNADSPIELYNLEEDIAETNNVAEQHPEIVEEMKQIMEEAHRKNAIYPLFSYEKTQANP